MGPRPRSRCSIVSAAERSVCVTWTHPYRPQTQRQVERFIRTLLAEWAYATIYGSSRERAQLSRCNFQAQPTALSASVRKLGSLS